MPRFISKTATLLLAASTLFPIAVWSQSGAEDNFSAPFSSPPVPVVDTAFTTRNTAYPTGEDDPLSLQRRLDATEEQLEMMRAELQSMRDTSILFDAAPAAGTPAGTAAAPAAAKDAKADKSDKAAAPQGPQEVPPFTSPTVKVNRFFHLDSGAYSQNANSRAVYGDMQDGVGFRRARLQASGKVAEFTNYQMEFDFAIAGRPSFVDVWVEQQKLPFFGNVRLGQFRQAFSLDALTSIKQIEFLERSAPFQAFVPFRRVGLMAYDKSENELWTWQYGGYRTGGFNQSPLGDTRFATDIGDNGGYSFSGRGTHLLWYDEPAEGRYLAHIGGSYNYSRTTGTATTPGYYEARSIPEFFLGDPAGNGLTANGTPFILDGGRLSTDHFQNFGLEFAGQYGAFHYQGEYIATFVDQMAGPTVFYDGAYVQAGYFLTGENRTYNKQFGALDKLVPFTDFFSLGRGRGIAGWGAWEVNARYSYLNLSDSAAMVTNFAAGPAPTPNPGILNESTVGLTWWWNQYMKLQFNWIHADVNGDIFGRSATDFYAGRCQLEF